MPPPPPILLSAKERQQYRRHQLWNDHGIFRELFYVNFHEVGMGAYRSAQPAPYQLRHWHRRYGLRAVLNLRAPAAHEPQFQLEQEVCDALGMEHVLLHGIGSRDLPRREQFLEAIETLERLPRPFLMHCKSGADRAGFMSVLYSHLQLGQSLEEASAQLRIWPYGHIRHANTGILDWFFTVARRQALQDAHFDLRRWIAEDYDREAILASFRPWYRLDWLTDRLLRRE